MKNDGEKAIPLTVSSKGGKIKILAALVVAVVVVTALVWFFGFRNRETAKEPVMELDVDKTIWVARGNFEGKETALIISFREKKSVIIRDLGAGTDRLYDYDYALEGGKGVIYYIAKREVLKLEDQKVVFETGGGAPLKDEFTRTGNVLLYQDVRFEKVSTDGARQFELGWQTR